MTILWWFWLWCGDSKRIEAVVMVVSRDSGGDGDAVAEIKGKKVVMRLYLCVVVVVVVIR